jgi:hypothetical protein
MPRKTESRTKRLPRKADEILDFTHTHQIDFFEVLLYWLDPDCPMIELILIVTEPFKDGILEQIPPATSVHYLIEILSEYDKEYLASFWEMYDAFTTDILAIKDQAFAQPAPTEPSPQQELPPTRIPAPPEEPKELTDASPACQEGPAITKPRKHWPPTRGTNKNASIWRKSEDPILWELFAMKCTRSAAQQEQAVSTHKILRGGLDCRQGIG